MKILCKTVHCFNWYFRSMGSGTLKKATEGAVINAGLCIKTCSFTIYHHLHQGMHILHAFEETPKICDHFGVSHLPTGQTMNGPLYEMVVAQVRGQPKCAHSSLHVSLRYESFPSLLEEDITKINTQVQCVVLSIRYWTFKICLSIRTLG